VKLSFKKKRRVPGDVYPETAVKADGRQFGSITYRRQSGLWSLGITVYRENFTPTPEDPCGWRWLFVEGFPSDPSAREYAKSNWEQWQREHRLHYLSAN
jgi:hypothetical protein